MSDTTPTADEIEAAALQAASDGIERFDGDGQSATQMDPMTMLAVADHQRRKEIASGGNIFNNLMRNTVRLIPGASQ